MNYNGMTYSAARRMLANSMGAAYSLRRLPKNLGFIVTHAGSEYCRGSTMSEAIYIANAGMARQLRTKLQEIKAAAEAEEIRLTEEETKALNETDKELAERSE